MVNAKQILKVLDGVNSKELISVSSIDQYECEMLKAIQTKDGNELSFLLGFDICSSPNIDHVLLQQLNDSFKLPHYEWANLFKYHIRVLRLLRNDKLIEAFETKEVSVSSFIAIMGETQDWFLPVLHNFSKDLRQLSILAEEDASKRRATNLDNVAKERKQIPKPDALFERAAECLMKLFRACLGQKYMRLGIAIVANQLFKLYIKFDKVHLFKPIIRALGTTDVINNCSLAQRVTFKYYDGLKSILEHNPSDAEDKLEFAYRNCHPKSIKNRYLCLVYLIPVKMQFGIMPSDKLLEKYNLTRYYLPIKNSTISGNIDQLNSALDTNRTFFSKYGVHNTLEKLRILCYRNLFKKVVLSLRTHVIPIDIIRIALGKVSSEMRTNEDIICILTNLIYVDQLKGYISISQEKLVVSKTDPFPKKTERVRRSECCW